MQSKMDSTRIIPNVSAESVDGCAKASRLSKGGVMGA